MKPSSRLLKQAINSDAGHPNFVYDPHNPTNTKKYREDIDRIQHDLQILSQKIAEVRGDSPTAVSLLAPSSSSIEVSSGKKGGGDSGSPFVTGIRTLAESERTRAVAGGVDIKDQKISALESLLEKIGDYDRLVLARTVPAETNSNGQPQRRKSFGTDLNVLPTHLRVIDRLMDLYSSSKRVTVLRQTVTPPPSNSTNQQDTPPTNNPNYIPPTQPKPAAAPDPALQKAVEELKSNLSKAQQKLELSESRRVEAENQYEFKSKDYDALQKKYDSLQETQHQHDAELQKQKILYQQLLDSMKQFEGQSSNLQEKLEIEISQNQRLLNILMNKIQAIQKDNQSVLSSEQSNADDAMSYHGMPEKYQMILQALDAAISERFSGYRSEVQLVLSLKDMIETEMNSLTVQKDLLSKDFQTLQDEHDALKTAYHSLSYESATSMSSTKQEKAEISKLQKEISGLQEIVRNQTETITRLERDKQIQSLSENSMKQYELYNKELEQKILNLEKEKNDLEFHQKTARLEVERYKDLTEKLKQKLKDSTSSSNQKNDFFDTFEEVMKEEMMTMKMAFETKLKLAREESDALQRKHQQEILRLQASSSPFSASKR